jgi:hypothetical protein
LDSFLSGNGVAQASDSQRMFKKSHSETGFCFEMNHCLERTGLFRNRPNIPSRLVVISIHPDSGQTVAVEYQGEAPIDCFNDESQMVGNSTRALTFGNPLDNAIRGTTAELRHTLPDGVHGALRDIAAGPHRPSLNLRHDLSVSLREDC